MAKSLRPFEYAERLYMARDCKGTLTTYRDTEIVNCRVRAFIDGAHWERRRAAKARRAKGKDGKP